MLVAVVLGTRPEIIKLAPVLHELARWRIRVALVHTGQHYSYELDRVFFEQFGLATPTHNLEIGSGSHGYQTGRMLERLEAILTAARPEWALVHGDTNSTVAGALAAAKLNIPVAHVEAGLRSYDRTMPEEVNRVIADHLAALLFAPTAIAQANLAAEGIQAGVVLTGNTIVDAVNYQRARFTGRPLAALGLEAGGYLLLTLHRQENTNDRGRLGRIIAGLRQGVAAVGLPLVAPLHPRTRRVLAEFGLEREFMALPGVRVTEPVDYVTSLELQAAASAVLTDSGGLQEEACILGTPCVTLRDNTERPETLAIGANVLTGDAPERIAACVAEMAGKRGAWPNPFGDGMAAGRIVAALAG